MANRVRTTVVISLDDPLTIVRAVHDGRTTRRPGNLIGVVGIRPEGGWYFYAECGDHGSAASETEAIAEVRDAWYGRE